jgi:hypothetical protein
VSATVPATPFDRLMAPLRTLFAEMIAPTRFYGTYEFTIATATSTTCTGAPTDASQGLPPMAGWPMRGGVCGESSTPTPGSLCEVIFVNGDRGRPEVVRVVGPPLRASLDATAELDLGASSPLVAVAGGGPAIGRVGDAVSVTFTTADAALILAPPGTVGGPCSAAGAITLTGTITAGSAKGQCG